MSWFTIPIRVRSISLFGAHFVLEEQSPPGNPWIDDWKNNRVGFPCKRMHVSEIENQHSTVPMCARIKNILFRAFWAALCSLQTLSNANTAENAVSQTPQNSSYFFLLLSLPPSHYLIRHCGCSIHFHLSLSQAFLATSVWVLLLHCFPIEQCRIKILIQTCLPGLHRSRHTIHLISASHSPPLSQWIKHES